MKPQSLRHRHYGPLPFCCKKNHILLECRLYFGTGGSRLQIGGELDQHYCEGLFKGTQFASSRLMPSNKNKAPAQNF